MHLLSALMIGLAANLDNFGIGISYGIQKIRIPFLSNFFIALLSGVIVALSVSAGYFLSHFVGVANLAGAFLIIAIGMWVAIHKSSSEPAAVPVTVTLKKTYLVSLKPLHCVVQIIKNPSLADIDANGFISAKESMALGLTLSLNCIATGVGAGLTGMSPLSVALFVFFFSMVTISAGYWTGWRTASNRLERWAQGVSGVLLIVIGIYEIFN
ncbi:sporulation membrane protein YtaF [Desulfitobacterium sp.]|uniref:sporulation membrane protein YtaF n=1 Tax=Desulfitobacterium sp. TaxID=49981 RepID=UPI002C863F84|nr:sporulation membrane protein YtaF [Desulfitobacterium sp.]HVJ48480.1 sporulation membrane protein YtaF [Desulfitobacterium sp.]